VTSSRLIGRTAELQQLEAALADASTGRPSLAFVAGDSGVGKTRLLNELLARARDTGARVLSGDAVELGEGELPYAALVGALRPLARAGDPALDALDPRARAELARLLPGLAGAAPAGAEDEPAQARLFEAVLALLDLLGAETPVLLALEDLHWADRSTRAFLAFLGSSLCRERVLVVGTYRLDELHRRHPLRPLLAELERDAGVRRLTLPPLTRDEAADALEDILGAPPADALRDGLYARSEGNPLFMEELLASGLEGRPDALPTTLRDALMVRVERLGDAAQDVLRVLAVGQRLDHETLAEVSDLDAGTLRNALREAVASHIVVVDADGRHRFRHALLGEVVEDDLLPGERTDFHRLLARALEQREPNAQIAAAIANHYAAAGDQPAALKAAVDAAGAAVRVHAHGEAGALLERALQLWDRVPDAEALTGGDRATLLRRAAEAYLAAGEHTRPEPLLRAAVDLVDEQAEPRRAAGLLERLAFAQWRSGGGESRALASARRALELAGEEPSPERAAILAWWAKTRMLQGRFSDAVRAAREAIDAAEAGGNATARSGALNAMGVALAGQGAVEEGAAALRKAVEIAEAEGRPSELESAYTNLADVLHLAGRTREALDVARRALDDAATSGYKTNWLSVVIAELLTELGEWDEAERLLPELDRRMSGVLKVNVELRRAELALGRGQHDRAAERLARIEDLVAGSSEPQWHGPFGTLTAELRRRQGDLDGARKAVDDALDRIEFCTEDVARLARVSAVGAAVEADRAQRGRDLADPEDVERAHAIMLGLLARVEAAAEGGGAVEAAWLAMARADAARAEGADDPERWAHAAEAWTAVERPYVRAVAYWRRAEALVGRGDREAAAASAAAALEITRRLGAGWLHGEVEGLIARARLRLEDEETAPVAPAGAEHNGDEVPFGLTPRERQVLALVARGATNREIGTELFMAEKTASVHVSRILAKLDVRSRTQAAAVAHRMGLTD
jgi:ATP/maltotriose-dependent transcriptional regulator MalT